MEEDEDAEDAANIKILEMELAVERLKKAKRVKEAAAGAGSGQSSSAAIRAVSCTPSTPPLWALRWQHGMAALLRRSPVPLARPMIAQPYGHRPTTCPMSR